MNRPDSFRRFREDHAHVLDRLHDLERVLGPSRAAPIESAQEAAVRDLLALLERQFATHMRAEEEVLFPVLSDALPGTTATLEPLEAEHTELRQMLSDLCNRLTAPRSPARDAQVRVELRDFLDLIRLHIDKEEATVFVVAARVLTPHELDSIATRLAVSAGERENHTRRSIP